MRGHPPLLLVYMGLATCLDTLPHREQNQDIFLDPPEAQSFLVNHKRFPRANHWDLELLTPGNLERECQEERCSWEEARECFEDNTATERFWENYKYNGKGGRGRVDVAGLAVGLTCGILLIVLAGLGAFWYLQYQRRRSHLGVQESCLQETGLILLSPMTPQSPPLPPGLPTYEQALAASGVHDAPPPPYSRYRAWLPPGWRGERQRVGGAGPLRAGPGASGNLRGAGLAGGGGPYAIVCRGVDQPCRGAAFLEGGACAHRVEDWLRLQGRVGVVLVGGGAV